jgi:hypothetical protein
MFLRWETIRHEQHCNATWIEFKHIELNSNSTKFNSTIGLWVHWMELKFNWRQMRCKLIGGKGIQNHLVNMVLEKKL